MAKPTYARDERPAPVTTLTEIFLGAVDAYGERPAFGRILKAKGAEFISYNETLARVKCVAGALDALGLERGERVAIMSPNRLEWALADYACLCTGVVDVPVYATLTAPQVAYILKDSGARLVFVSDKGQMAKALDAIAQCGHPVQVVVFEPPAEIPEGVWSWADFMDAGASRAARWTDEEFRARALRATPGDLATVLYTSGTTGDPKGVMLTHGNIGSNVMVASTVLYIDSGDSTVSFLPLSHILQRMVDYLFLHRGVPITHARSMATAIEDMRTMRPTVAVAVPRIYEKIHDTVMGATGSKKKLIDWAVAVADRVAGLRLSGRMPTGALAFQYWLADAMVFSKVREAMGGRMRWFVSGSAPLAPELNRFFYSIGLSILEGYGLTETSPVTNVNTEDHFRIGTVGKAVPGTEIRIAEDGEILVRGPQVMKGYWNRPEDTAEAIDAEGWFHTGDIGELDEDLFLRITDRKKDLIVTAGGKNVAPQPIENRLKTNLFIEQAVLIGDRRKFISVLVVPAFPRLETWAREQGITWRDRRDLLSHPTVQRHMESEVKRELTGLASFETPKRVALLEDEFTIANGVLTPTLKVKRKVIQERFHDTIEELYGGGARGAGRH